jgi:hypothetical protein
MLAVFAASMMRIFGLEQQMHEVNQHTGCEQLLIHA